MECGDYVEACPKTYVNHSRGKMFCRFYTPTIQTSRLLKTEPNQSEKGCPT